MFVQTTIENDSVYIRTESNNKTILSEKMASLYKAAFTEIVSSGTNAIYLTLKTIAEKNKLRKSSVFLVGDETFTPTRTQVIKSIQTDYPNIEVCFFDQSNDYSLISLINNFGSNITCVFFESCSNPNGKIINWDLLKLLPKSPNNSYKNDCTVVVDNTWLSPFCFNPFIYNVDVVVESCSKYMSNCKCISGAIHILDSKSELAQPLNRLIKTLGIHVSPQYCQTILKELDSCESRILASYKRTLEILVFLQTLVKENKYVDIVNHPSLNVNRFKTICLVDKSESSLGPSVISFHVVTNKTSKKKLHRYVETLVKANNIKFKTSFGHSVDSIDFYPHKDETGIWLRLAVGYEDDLDFLGNFLKLLTDL